jgi:ABC-type multidrug transport system ATPase subunit
MMAIMGQSGSGKTSLLNVLGGRYLTGVTGSVLLTGKSYSRDMRHRIGFVAQNDVFLPFPQLTVRQQLIFNATVRTSSSVSHIRLEEIVDMVLAKLEITYCANASIACLSGGEKRRTTIGCQLVVSPQILLVDEPTSGLDSSAASSLITLIRSICRLSRISVAATIHQPSSKVFFLFDKLLILSGGSTAYVGSPRDVVSEFSSLGFLPPSEPYNPADFIIEVLSSNEARTSSCRCSQPLFEHPIVPGANHFVSEFRSQSL